MARSRSGSKKLSFAVFTHSTPPREVAPYRPAAATKRSGAQFSFGVLSRWPPRPGAIATNAMTRGCGPLP